MRKVVAIDAVPGLVAGIPIFIASFWADDGQTGSESVSAACGYLRYRDSLDLCREVVQRRGFRGKPRWVLRSMQILFIAFVVVFFTFLALSHAASPEIINGEYVLNGHGKIIGHLSERAYLFLKGWELRLFAAGWILAYFAIMMPWWYPWQDEWTVVMPD